MTIERASEIRDGTILYTIDRWTTHGIEAFVVDNPASGVLGARGNAWFASRSGADGMGAFRVMAAQTAENGPDDHGRLIPLRDVFTGAREAGNEARRRIDAAIDRLTSARYRTYTIPLPPILLLRECPLPPATGDREAR